MRSTPELIAELEEESSKHWYVTMAVAFENSTVFVKANDGDSLRSLNDAINAGGMPVGLIAVDQDQASRTAQIITRIYPENSDVEEQCSWLLTTLAGHLAKSLTSKGGIVSL
jgi:hypothetical protein